MEVRSPKWVSWAKKKVCWQGCFCFRGSRVMWYNKNKQTNKQTKHLVFVPVSRPRAPKTSRTSWVIGVSLVSQWGEPRPKSSLITSGWRQVETPNHDNKGIWKVSGLVNTSKFWGSGTLGPGLEILHASLPRILPYASSSFGGSWVISFIINLVNP